MGSDGLSGVEAVIGGQALAAPPRARSLQQAAHDIRTPLATVIQGVDELLELTDDKSMRARRLFDVLLRNVIWMGEVLEASATPTEPPRHSFDLLELTRETVDLIQPVLAARDQAVTIESNRRTVSVHADYGTVMRAVLNLLDNASKYGPTGDTLTVSVRRRRAGAVVAVSDHGPGIPRGDRHSIFRAFYRTAGAQRSGQKGSGLGLASVREVAEAHGGTAGVTCRQGATRVWFYLADPDLQKRNR